MIKPHLTSEERKRIVDEAFAIRDKAIAEGKIEFWDIDRINAELGRDQRIEHLEACREGTLDESVYAPHNPRNAPRLLTGAYSIGMSVETESVVLPPLTAEERKAIVDRAMEIKRKAMAEGKIEFWDVRPDQRRTRAQPDP